MSKLDEQVLISCAKPEGLAQMPTENRVALAESVFKQCCRDYDLGKLALSQENIDKVLSKIDLSIEVLLDEVLHHPDFQQLESAWLSAQKLSDASADSNNTRVDIWPVSQEELIEDLNSAQATDETALYRKIYTHEFDMPGGEPYAAMITDFYFSHDTTDLDVLAGLSEVAAQSHCPFIANAQPTMFDTDNWGEAMMQNDWHHTFESADYLKWRQFRETENARYIGLCLPRVLRRTPYGPENKTQRFHYEERTASHDDYLWGAASFDFGANLLRSFESHGWAVNIRGPESGGRIDDLPMPVLSSTSDTMFKIPTEVMISESQELALAELGFIPLSYYKNRNYACFFSANSIQSPASYLDDAATANSRINARLPYVFLASRLGHYLKVMQRENIGTSLDANDIQRELNTWLKTLITKMPTPSPAHLSSHPLRDGEIKVSMRDDNPGFYKVDLYAMPHFQIEGMDVRLYLVSQIPIKNKE